MKKCLLMMLLLMTGICASATHVVKNHRGTASVAVPLSDESVSTLTMNQVLVSLYDDKNYKVPNFYLIFSDSKDAVYNSNTGEISAPDGAFTLVLDLYNYTPEDGVYLPEGTYTVLEDDNVERAFGYSYNYSMFNYYTGGKQVSYLFDKPVEVSRDAKGQYTISTTVNVGNGTLVNVVYNGPVISGSSTERPTVYPQIKENVSVNLDKGGISYYQGVTDTSSQGVSYFDLYDVDFDKETGAMKDEGYSLCMMIAHKRFTKRADYAVVPGTYTNANNLARNTWYPCREIDYLGMVYPFGSYLRKLKIVNGERTYTYAYLKSGEFTIVDNGDGTYSGKLEAITTLGYEVNATWSGSITLDTSNASFQATVSDLTDDVDLNFTNLDKGRIYHSGIQGGCRTLIVDLGSPSGRDPGINYGGDLLRMEFLVDKTNHLLQPGLYTVVPRRWNSNELAAGGTYEPMSLNKGYFDSQGAQIGTRYAHFKEGSYCVYDMVGPAEEGSVRVETDDYQTYRFTIDLKDDAGFEIRGYWDKPIEYYYDPEALKKQIDDESGVNAVFDDADGSSVSVVVEGANIFVLNGGNEVVTVYRIDGTTVLTTTADKMIPVDNLGAGYYIINVKNTSIKIKL